MRSLGQIALMAAVAVTVLSVPGTVPARADCRVPSFTYRHGVVMFTERERTTPVRVEIADTPAAQEVGLMCRTSLDPDAGMLFEYKDLTRGAFWMKDTLIPLSIAFIDGNWRIVSLMDMKVAPDPDKGPFEYYTPARSYRYALEVNQGFFAQHEIDEKADVHFTLQEARYPRKARWR